MTNSGCLSTARSHPAATRIPSSLPVVNRHALGRVLLVPLYPQSAESEIRGVGSRARAVAKSPNIRRPIELVPESAWRAFFLERQLQCPFYAIREIGPQCTIRPRGLCLRATDSSIVLSVTMYGSNEQRSFNSRSTGTGPSHSALGRRCAGVLGPLKFSTLESSHRDQTVSRHQFGCPITSNRSLGWIGFASSSKLWPFFRASSISPPVAICPESSRILHLG